MKELVTTYTIKVRKHPLIWEFQYDLNGFLKAFKIEGILNQKQREFLFYNFPYTEKEIDLYKKNVKLFEVIIGKPDLSFDTFWKLYNYKMGKINAQKQWKKLTELEKLNAIKSIKAYDGFLKRKQIAKVYPERYLKYKRFDDQFNAY